jgi:hypothetical protein
MKNSLERRTNWLREQTEDENRLKMGTGQRQKQAGNDNGWKRE